MKYGMRLLAIVAICLSNGRLLEAETPPEILKISGVNGGLIVHLGCGNGGMTAALFANDSYLVHGLDRNADHIAAARKNIQARGLYGKVSCEQWDGEMLPYADDLVNLLIVEDSSSVSTEEMMRVLAPLGIAYIREGEKWSKKTKPWPSDIDEWTHYLYGANNNAVSRDTRVGPPRRLRWLASPKRSRDHDSLASLSAMTSCGGRIFYIHDEGPTSLIHRPSRWKLISRDAFNGIVLWKRDIPDWITQLYHFRAGPVWLSRRLVSIDKRVYTTLGLDAPVTALDADNGKTVLTYQGSEKTEEIIRHENILLLAVGAPRSLSRQAPTVLYDERVGTTGDPPGNQRILAYNADSGKPLWEKAPDSISYLVPLSLTAFEDKVFYLDREHVCCLDMENGTELWRSDFPTEHLFVRSYAPTVVAADGVLLCLSRERLSAFSTTDGRPLWETDKGFQGFNSPGDLFVIDNKVWTVPNIKESQMEKSRILGDGGELIQCRDLKTGELKRSIRKDDVWYPGHHHRCYRNKATPNYVITGRTGTDFLDAAGDNHETCFWIRGECQYGVMPANGLLYVPPDPCRCASLYKMSGFQSLTAASSLDAIRPPEKRLLKGPAYATDSTVRILPSVGARKTEGMVWHPPVHPQSNDWPMYRRDITRSGSIASTIPADIQGKWKTALGGKLSSPVVVGERLFVSAVDQHSVCCLNAENGERIWTFVAGGPVDSPPTIRGNMALFGSRDGHVYAVRIEDGALAWKFLAAPVDRSICVEGRLESIWPVHGSVLVMDRDNETGGPVVYFAAGRSSFLDGGIRLYGLDVASGEVLYQNHLHASNRTMKMKTLEPDMVATLPDVLVSNGEVITMRHVRFDRTLKLLPEGELDTMFSSIGLLEDSWMHRLQCTLGFRKTTAPLLYRAAGETKGGIANGKVWNIPDNPFGKLIVFNDQCAYVVQNPYCYQRHVKQLWPEGQRTPHQKYSTYQRRHFPTGVRLYAQKNAICDRIERRSKWTDFASTTQHLWTRSIPLQVRAMVLTGNHLFVAGWPDKVAIQEKTGESTGDVARNHVLQVMSTASGEELAEYPLAAPPIFDGMIAAKGNIYLATDDGHVSCLSPGDATESKSADSQPVSSEWDQPEAATSTLENSHVKHVLPAT